MQITQTGGDGKTEALVRLFSAIFVQKDFPVKQSYTNLLQSYYSAIVQNLDFAMQPQQSTNVING